MRVDVASCADAREYAGELLEAVKELKPDLQPNAERLTDVETENRIWAEEMEEWSTSTNKLMHPRRFLRELTRAIPDGSIVTTDIGNNSSMINSYLKFSGIRRHLAALSWGNCGFAYGAAMGAKLGKPDAAVFAFQGDGAYGMSGLSEVMTAVRENIPIIAIVANNSEWGAEKKNQVDFYDNRYIGTNLPENPDYAKLAEIMGATGYTVEDYGDVQDVVREAVACGKPCVINAIVQGGKEVLAEPFRRDALRIPVHYLPKYAHLNVAAQSDSETAAYN
jgi:sulfoacetaldehyde acetyltransferase